MKVEEQSEEVGLKLNIQMRKQKEKLRKQYHSPLHQKE